MHRGEHLTSNRWLTALQFCMAPSSLQENPWVAQQPVNYAQWALWLQLRASWRAPTLASKGLHVVFQLVAIGALEHGRDGGPSQEVEGWLRTRGHTYQRPDVKNSASAVHTITTNTIIAFVKRL